MNNLPVVKFKIASVMFDIIASRPYEQFNLLLETIVNKLGDPDYEVSSKILYYMKNHR
jgi:hypothetical protein